MSAELTILGAAWGPSDVTKKVQGLVHSQTIRADTSTFGDTWVGVKKSFVVFYCYSGQECQLAIATDGDNIELSPPTGMEAPSKADRTKELFNPGKVTALADVTSREITCNQPLHILGAVYGLGDVTLAAREKVQSGTTFAELADSDTWGEHWEGVPKTLVVAYKYGDNGVPMLSIVKEKEHMSLSDPSPPPLYILGASNGPIDATNLAQEHVKNGELVVKSWLHYDPMPGTQKTEVVVYQYGNQTIQMDYSADGVRQATIKYDYTNPQLPQPLESTNPQTLTILKAMYWTVDVTENCKSLVSDNELHLIPQNTLPYDPKSFTKKTLVIVYQYGSNKPLMKIAVDGEQVAIKKNPPPIYSGLIDARELLEGGDTIALQASNGKYVTCNDKQKLVASQDEVTSSSYLTIELNDENTFRIKSFDGNYLIVGKDKSLYASEQIQNKAPLFHISCSRDGAVRLSTHDELSNSFMYLRFNSNDNGLKADTVEYFSESTAFHVAIHEQKVSNSSRSLEELSADELKELKFYTDVTMGFFTAMGLGPYFSVEETISEIGEYINGNPIAKKAMIDLEEAAKSATNAPAVVPHAIRAIGVLYKQGVLWKLIKLFLKSGGWIVLTRVLAKTIQVVFLPDSQIAVLLASLTAWAETIRTDVKNS